MLAIPNLEGLGFASLQPCPFLTMAVSALSSLTWEETVSEAKRWTQDGVSKFSVEKCDEGSKRISLCGPNCSFFVELPHDGDEEWVRCNSYETRVAC